MTSCRRKCVNHGRPAATVRCGRWSGPRSHLNSVGLAEPVIRLQIKKKVGQVPLCSPYRQPGRNLHRGPEPREIPESRQPESRRTGLFLYRRLHEQPRLTWSRTEPVHDRLPFTGWLRRRPCIASIIRNVDPVCRREGLRALHSGPTPRNRRKSRLPNGLNNTNRLCVCQAAHPVNKR